VQQALKAERRGRDDRMKAQRADKQARLAAELSADVLRAAAAEGGVLPAGPVGGATAASVVPAQVRIDPLRPPPTRAPAHVRVSQHIAVLPLNAAELSSGAKPVPPAAAAFAARRFAGANVRRVAVAHQAAGKRTGAAPVFRRAGGGA
jgi:hypothetical protein